MAHDDFHRKMQKAHKAVEEYKNERAADIFPDQDHLVLHAHHLMSKRFSLEVESPGTDSFLCPYCSGKIKA